MRLPPGENMNDWLAVHVVDFFNRINLIYGTVSEYCTETTCPKMSGGSRLALKYFVAYFIIKVSLIDTNTFGLTVTNIKSQRHYQPPNISRT